LVGDFSGDLDLRAGVSDARMGAGVMGLGSFEPGVLGTPMMDPFGGASNKGDVGSSERWFIARVRETSLCGPRIVILFVPAAGELDRSEVKFNWLS